MPSLRFSVCVAGLLALAPALHAQGCDSVVSRTTLSELAGRAIASVSVVTQEPSAMPVARGVLDKLHVKTRDATIRRLLLVSPGGTIDTVRIAESLRRLRQLKYLTNIEIIGRHCGEGPVDLTVHTRDVYSVKPSLQVRSASQAFSLTERNVLGTGREASVGLKADEYGVRPSASLRDPWFLGRDLSLDLTTSGDGERGARAASIQKRERSVLDAVGLEARLASSAFDAEDVTPGSAFASIRRLNGAALVSHRVRTSESGVLHVISGAEFDFLNWESPADGPRVPIRRFAGPSLGLRRRSVAYDTLTWLLPRAAIVDIPLSTEFDVLASFGGELDDSRVMTHADAWAGRLWMVGRRSLVVTDFWASGFLSDGRWSAATLRASVDYERAAQRGLWSARLGVERWLNPDPDLRAVATADPTQRIVGSGVRASPRTAVFTLERSVHLRNFTRSYTLDIAGFGAASYRDSAQVAAVGIGFRLVPTRLGRATARFDIGYPAWRSGDVNSRPYVFIGITPWLEQDRARDGRRVR